MRLNVYNVHGGLFTSGIILLKSCLENFLPFMIKYLNMFRCSLYKIKKHTKNEFIESFGQRKMHLHELDINKKTYLWINNLLEKVYVVS